MIPLDASATTLTKAPVPERIVIAMSPALEVNGRVMSRPLIATRLPSSDSPSPADPMLIGAGSTLLPSIDTSLATGRISVCPYGSAMGPLTRRMAPRGGVATPAGRRTTMPAVESAIASSGGVPSRPASAVTTPVTLTVDPTAAVRATEMGMVVAVGCGVGVGDEVGSGVGVEVGCGVGTWVGVGVGPGVEVEVGSGDGVAVGSGVGPGDVVGVGVGDVGVGVGGGAEVMTRSEGRVT